MKLIASLLVLLTGSFASSGAEIVTLVSPLDGPGQIRGISAGEVAEVITCSGGTSGTGISGFRVITAGVTNSLASGASVSSGGIVSLLPMVLAGPLSLQTVGGGVITFRVRTKSEYLAGLSPSVAAGPTSVVIPEDAAGPVTIALESSTDLVNWTAANPGTYGTSTVKRFFRVRAINQ